MACPSESRGMLTALLAAVYCSSVPTHGIRLHLVHSLIACADASHAPADVLLELAALLG